MRNRSYVPPTQEVDPLTRRREHAWRTKVGKLYIYMLILTRTSTWRFRISCYSVVRFIFGRWRCNLFLFLLCMWKLPQWNQTWRRMYLNQPSNNRSMLYYDIDIRFIFVCFKKSKKKFVIFSRFEFSSGINFFWHKLNQYECCLLF